MVDRGFIIYDIVVIKRVEFVILVFIKGKSQFSFVDVESICGIVNVRIYVERVIGLLRNKYIILQGIFSIDYLIISE